MQLSHSPSETSAVFDDPNLVSCAGLAPVVALAERCGLTDLVASMLTLPVLGGVNPHVKIPALGCARPGPQDPRQLLHRAG